MTWKHRKGGQWSSPTMKVRRNGQWVTIGGGGGGGGANTPPRSYLPWGDPPTRSNTVDISNYSSLQTALNSISPDTRLTLDGTATYTGNWSWPSTPNITLDGQGATLRRSSTTSQMLRRSRGNEYSSYTTPGGDGTYSAGQEWIDVSSTSGFSAGGIILIRDHDQLHPDTRYASSGSGDEGTGYYHVVSEVDSSGNRLRLEEPTLTRWRNPTGSLRIYDVEFEAINQRITNCRFDGRDPNLEDDTNVCRFFRTKDLWMDNITGFDGTGMPWMAEGYGLRVHNCDYRNSATKTPKKRKTINLQDGQHHTLVTDCTTTDFYHESFTQGAGGNWWGARNAEYRNCRGTNGTDTAFDVHPGAEDIRYFNCTTDNCRFLRPRATNIRSEDCEVANPNTYPIYSHNDPEDLYFNKIHVHGSIGANRVFYWTTKSGRGASLDRAEFHDFYVQDANNDLSTFWRLRNQDSSTVNVGLEIDHVAVDNTWITASNFSNWSYNTGSINLSTSFNHPTDGTSPADYFANKYGW